MKPTFLAMKVDARLRERLVELHAAIDAQTKMIANLEATNKELRVKLAEQKKASGMAFYNFKPNRVKFGRNADWKQSARLGLLEGLWMASTALIESCGTMLVLSVGMPIACVAIFFAWLVARPAMVVLGLCGMLCKPAVTPSQRK